MSDAFCKPGTIDAVLAWLDNTEGKGSIPFFVAVRVELSGRLISGPLVGCMLLRHTASSSFMKCDVAPLSLFANTCFCLGREVMLLILCRFVVGKHKLFVLLLLNVSLFSPPHIQRNRTAIPL